MLVIAEVNITKKRRRCREAQAVLAQKQEANRCKQALVGRDVVSQQVAEEAEAKAEGSVALSEAESAKAQLTTPAHSSRSRGPFCAIGRWLRLAHWFSQSLRDASGLGLYVRCQAWCEAGFDHRGAR